MNASSPDGATALHSAAHWDDLERCGPVAPRPRQNTSSTLLLRSTL